MMHRQQNVKLNSLRFPDRRQVQTVFEGTLNLNICRCLSITVVVVVVPLCYVVQFKLKKNSFGNKLSKKIYRTIILPVVLYGCETWSLTLREKLRLRVFESRMLGRLFGPKRDEVTRGWREIHNKELYDLYCSKNKIRVIKSRRMRRAEHVARIGERCVQGFGGEPRGKETIWKTHAWMGG